MSPHRRPVDGAGVGDADPARWLWEVARGFVDLYTTRDGRQYGNHA